MTTSSPCRYPTSTFDNKYDSTYGLIRLSKSTLAFLKKMCYHESIKHKG